MNRQYNIGRHRAFTDWLRGGEFRNPFEEGTPESDGYEAVEYDQECMDLLAEKADYEEDR